MAPKPPPVRKTLLWAGLAGIFGVAGAGALVYWFSGGWSGPNYRPAIPPIIGVASPHSARHPTTVGPGTSQPVVPLEIPPETILQANDTSTLTHLASDYSDNPQTVTVEGQITSNEISKKGKYFRLSFIGADGDKDFVCTYPPTLLPALQTKFGSSDGLGLQGNTIRITGKIEMVKGHPTIRIESSNQIQLAE